MRFCFFPFWKFFGVFRYKPNFAEFLCTVNALLVAKYLNTSYADIVFFCKLLNRNKFCHINLIIFVLANKIKRIGTKKSEKKLSFRFFNKTLILKIYLFYFEVAVVFCGFAFEFQNAIIGVGYALFIKQLVAEPPNHIFCRLVRTDFHFAYN